MTVGLLFVGLIGLLAAARLWTRNRHVMWPDYVSRLRALPDPIREKR